MTKSTQKDNIAAICELRLIYPFSESLSNLISLSNVWGIRLIQTSSKAPMAKISIPSKVFKNMFGEYPKDQKVYQKDNLKHIFTKLTVTNIKVKND